MGQPKLQEIAASAAPPAPAPWARPSGLSRRGLAVLVGVVVAVNLPVLHYYLVRGRPAAPVGLPYSTDFSDPGVVSRDFWSTGGLWRAQNGELVSPGVKNNPLWLKAKLPQDVAVEFDVKSLSAEGDIKVELFGDGTDHASGYVFIHGGWGNSQSIIARLDEHGVPLARLKADAQRLARERGLPSAGLVETGVFRAGTHMRVEANPFPVQVGRAYHWRIERRGSTLRWLIDGQPFMDFDDPFPLVGDGHDRFGFSSWEAQLYFDNLRVTAL